MQTNMRRILGRLALVAGLVLAVASPAAAEKRVALVIGNGAYEHVPGLRNPANDASDMARALRALGFEVIEGIDVDHGRMREVVRRFSDSLQGAAVGLFYYAGHGMQIAGQNYLMPVDAKLTREADLDFSAVGLDLVLRNMEREAATNIVFLDACRDNPMARSLARNMGTRSSAVGNGLAQVQSGIGTYIAFATQPGNVALDGVGRNSPFTGALLKHIDAPNRSLGDIMIAVRNDVMAATNRGQVPWEHHSLTGQFYFNRAAALASDPRADPAGPAPLRVPPSAPRETADRQGAPAQVALAPSVAGRVAEATRAPAHACDRLAAYRPDRELGVGHVLFREIDHARAVPACEAAVAAHPSEDRFVFQLARAADLAKDFQRARGLYESLADKGHAPAIHNLATLYEHGDGVARSHARALDLYRRAADLGHAGAMSNLGWMYERGLGVEANAAEAARHYRRAAQAGNAQGMSNLGWLLSEGNGVARDEVEGVRLFRRAVDLGHARGATNLGFMYEKGRGVATNADEAYRFYRLGAERGDSLGMNNVGWAYAQGLGVRANPDEAARWVSLALVHGNDWTMRQMRTNADSWGAPFKRALQTLLRGAGVYSGPIDGAFGPATLAAIEAYVRENRRIDIGCRCDH